MPYVDKILKKAYQKRTATPYMKEWRENNRERHRKYIREWARNRRLDKVRRAADLKKMKESPSYKANLASGRTTVASREAVKNLADRYVVATLTKHTNGMLRAKDIRRYPELIQIQKTIILTKRLLKNAHISNKQF